MEYSYADTILKVSNVWVTLGGITILRDVNLEIKDVRRPGMTQGQIVGLLGPSGIGKTTLFKVLAGLEKPDNGDVLVDKEARPVKRGEVGVVAQHYPLFEHRTVLGNLTVAGKQAGMNSSESLNKSREMLKKFGLDAHESKYPVQLSGGQRQRVAIAQQFMCSDHFLLMDEPFSGLDLLAIDGVIKLIREMAQADELKTFIIVTHDIAAALQVCDTIWLLGRDRDDKGNIVPGAKVHSIFNLIDRGIAWQDDNGNSTEFLECFREIRDIFAKL